LDVAFVENLGKMGPKKDTEKDSTKEKGKSRTKSSKDDDLNSSIDQSQEKLEKPEKQAKIDTMYTPVRSESAEKQPNLEDLLSMINSMDRNVKKLASQEYIEKSLKKLVTEQFVNEKLKTLKEDLGKEIKTEVDKVYEQLQNLNSDIIKIMDNIEKENERITKKNDELEEKLQERERRLKDHEVRLNNIEQYTRRNSVRIYGIEDTDKDESISKSRSLVIKMLKDKLEIDIKPTEIDIAHRLGKYQEDGIRPIICKFVSRTLKKEVIGVRRKLKGSKVVIREDLTAKNAKLLETVSAREEVSTAWSDDGKIIALLLNGKKVRFDIETDWSKPLIPSEELARLLRENSKRAK
jgi:hypothetical protein